MKKNKNRLVDIALTRFFNPILSVYYPVIICAADEARLADTKEARILSAQKCGKRSGTMYGLYWEARKAHEKETAKQGDKGRSKSGR